MKGFEYVLAKMQGETPSRTLAETATERARETALAAKEKAKGLASHAKKKQYIWWVAWMTDDSNGADTEFELSSSVFLI